VVGLRRQRHEGRPGGAAGRPARRGAGGYRIKVAFGVDEEYYSLGAHVLARSAFLDDVAAVVVPETGDGPNRWHGPSTIGLGRMGRCEYVVEVPGTGGHGAQAYNPDFVNAAVECARVVERIEALRREWRDEYAFAPPGVPDAGPPRPSAAAFTSTGWRRATAPSRFLPPAG